MTPKLALIISTVVVIAAFVAINSWAAVPKHESNSAAPIAAKGAIYRPACGRCTRSALADRAGLIDAAVLFDQVADCSSASCPY